MGKSNNKYKRLPGKRRKFMGKDTLWAASDHLLLVESTAMSEDYKRFYFKDIQSVSITKTLSATITNSILALVIVLLSLLTAYLWKSLNAATAFPFIIAGVCLFYLAMNLFKGASCDCWLNTAVQRVNLTPVNRCRAAVKMLTIIGPVIEQQQGVLSQDELEETSKNSLVNVNTKSKKPVDEKSSKNLILWYKALFVMCLISAVLEIGFLFYNTFFTVIISSLFSVGFTIVCIITAVRQSHRKIKKSIKLLPWSVLGVFIIGFIEGYALIFMTMFKNGQKPEIINNQIKLIQSMLEINHFDYPLILGADIFSITALTIIGMAGLFLVRKNRLS